MDDTFDYEPQDVSGGMGGSIEKPRRKTPEHSFQAWVDRLIDRVVLPPMFVTGIDHASQTTDNARARMAARGIKFGLPDVFVCQAFHSVMSDKVSSTCLWLELKRGSRLSSAQEGVHKAMREAGQEVVVCSSIVEVVAALRNCGFDLHANADNLAAEYEHRVQASIASHPKKRTTTKPPRQRLTARGRRFSAVYRDLLP